MKENTAAGGKVGDDPVTAEDADDDVLTYTFSGGADMDAFEIDDETGQITVGEGTMLDFEGSQTTYMVEVKAEDPFGKSDSAMVTIMVTNVNEPPDLMLVAPVTPPDTTDPTPEPENNAPEFDEGATADREVAENTAAGMPVGAPVAATDADNDTLTYTLSGSAYFAIDNDGQITTTMMLDHEDMDSHEVTVMADDGNDGTDTITVTIMVMNVGLDNAYDANDDGIMQRSEVITAIQDHFADSVSVTRQDVIEVIQLHFNAAGDGS